jgi:hypothetical protein
VGAGVEHARKAAVCRVCHPTKGVGTGFLGVLPPAVVACWGGGAAAGGAVSAPLLVTNNHVLRGPSWANDAWGTMRLSGVLFGGSGCRPLGTAIQ